MGTAAELNQFLVDVEKRAFAMAMVSVKNKDDALDIVQDVMMTLARKYATKPASEWTPLFFRILRNRITDHHRSGSIKRRILGWFSDDPEDDIEQIAGPRIDAPEFQQEQSDLRDRLGEAIGALPERQQQAFMLRVWEGMSVRESASVMGCSEGSVKTHLSRATATLRSLLPEYESE
ncbi:MAG: RNA polymerase sigma factor [Pseudomonadales bacterium]|nr:RNA polymerase sigma factor [Pseudomonadales bacterium]